MKVCSRCEALHDGESSHCKQCLKSRTVPNKQSRKHLLQDNKGEIHQYLWKLAARRAKINNLPFKRHSVEIPDYCPVLGIKMAVAENVIRDNSYSFDKIIPELGYVPGNVICISQRANRIKNNATLDELQKIAEFYKDLLT